MTHRLILLPGMHGTADLFAPLLKCAPSDIECLSLDYPVDQLLGYDELFGLIEHRIPVDAPIALVGESFSGPLAIRYAARNPQRVTALVLCATFVRYRVHAISPMLLRIVGRARPMDWMLRASIAGENASAELLHLVRSSVRRVEPRVMAHRLEQVGLVDVREELRRCSMPILYLRGDHDRIVRPSHLQEVMTCCPQLKVATLNAPHLLLQAAPKQAWDTITQFVGSL